MGNTTLVTMITNYNKIKVTFTEVYELGENITPVIINHKAVNDREHNSSKSDSQIK